MFNIGSMVLDAITNFFQNAFQEFIKFFATILSNIMSTSQDILAMPLIQNGVKYSQALALTLLVIKAINEGIQTYILYQNGDPDADPMGLLVRTSQAVAIILCVPFIVQTVFTFGTKVTQDVASLGTGKAGIADWTGIVSAMIATDGFIVPVILIVLVVMMLIVAIQSTIRGAELALMLVIGPIMALNLTANNRSVWTAWFRQLCIICVSQALQIFMISGAFSLFTNQSVTGSGILYVWGWLWVTIKTPKYIQQIAYSTGLTGTVGGVAKQAGMMAITRQMMAGAAA